MTAPLTVLERNRCNCTALRKAARRVSQAYDVALAPVGLRSTQFAILAEIDRRAGAPPTIQEIGQALVLDPSTIGQNLRPLTRAALVRLAPDLADRRRRNVTLTPQGRSRLTAARPLWEDAQARFERGYGEKAAAELRAQLGFIAFDLALSDEAPASGVGQ